MHRKWKELLRKLQHIFWLANRCNRFCETA